MNPIMPTRIMPTEQILMVNHSSLPLGFRASRSNLEHDFTNDLRPKAIHLLRFYHKRRNVQYIRIC